MFFIVFIMIMTMYPEFLDRLLQELSDVTGIEKTVLYHYIDIAVQYIKDMASLFDANAKELVKDIKAEYFH